MEKYEFGKHLAFEEVLKNKEYYAELFAEGSSTLKEILLYSFNHNIETYMCCAGHEEEDMPFIMFYIPYENKELIYSLASAVYNVDMASITLAKTCARNEIQVDLRSFCGNLLFRNIQEGLTNLDNANKVTPDIINVVEVLNRFENPTCDLNFIKSMIYGRDNGYTMWVDRHKENGSKELFINSERIDTDTMANLNSYNEAEKIKQRVK